MLPRFVFVCIFFIISIDAFIYFILGFLEEGESRRRFFTKAGCCLFIHQVFWRRWRPFLEEEARSWRLRVSSLCLPRLQPRYYIKVEVMLLKVKKRLRVTSLCLPTYLYVYLGYNLDIMFRVRLYSSKERRGWGSHLYVYLPLCLPRLQPRYYI